MRPLLLLLLLLLLLVVAGRGQRAPLFEKDHQMDTVFPPVVWKHPELPAGHLRSLGHQRHPDGPLKVTTRPLGAVEFFADAVTRRTPLVVRDAVPRDSPAMAAWTDEQLRRSFGHLSVTVTHRREPQRGSVEAMPLSEFLARYRFEDLYMASLVPEAMESDLRLPALAACGPVRRSASETTLWLSAGGTGSPLHSHSRHQLHCLLDGRKDFIVVEPKYRENFDFEEWPPGSGDGRSRLDVEMINGFEAPQVADAPWRYATLLPGDCVFLPAGHLHHVRGYGRSLSFVVAFAPRDRSLADCRSQPPGGVVSVAELPLVWTIDPATGRTRLKDGQLTPESLRLLLLQEAGDAAVLTLSAFRHFFDRAADAADADAGKSLDALKAFRALAGSDKKLTLSAAAIEKLPALQLDRIARFLNSLRRKVKDEL